MTVWVVFGWDDYCPNWDNTLGYILSEDDAIRCLEENRLKKYYDNYEYVRAVAV